MALYQSSPIIQIQSEDIAEIFNLTTSVSWISDNCFFVKQGNMVNFQLRGTFPSSVGNSFILATFPKSQLPLLKISVTPVISTVWSSPSFLASCFVTTHETDWSLNIIRLAGAPNVGEKGFIVNGIIWSR